MVEELSWLGGLFVGVIAVAALVNRLQPGRRHVVSRTLTVWLLYAAAIGLTHAFKELDRPTWATSTFIRWRS
jgi:hypothetical protein